MNKLDPEVYLAAAALVEDGDVKYSCNAIAELFESGEESNEELEYRTLFDVGNRRPGKKSNASELWAMDLEEARQLRVWMLLVMAAVVELGEEASDEQN